MTDKLCYKRNIGQRINTNCLNITDLHKIELDKYMNPIGWGAENGSD